MSSFREAIQSPTPVLVDFSAEWCGPCKMMPPILQQVKRRFENDLRILKVDVDKNPEAAGAYQIQSVPTLMLFQNGKVLWRQSGVMQAPAIIDVIEKMKS